MQADPEKKAGSFWTSLRLGAYGAVETLCFSNSRTTNRARGLIHPGEWSQVQTQPVSPALSPHCHPDIH